MFEVRATDKSTKARSGRLTTGHGVIETPAFMPVGTQGSVKAVSSRELRELNTQIVLGNTYHLFVRPGLDVIRDLGGLHYGGGRAFPKSRRWDAGFYFAGNRDANSDRARQRHCHGAG